MLPNLPIKLFYKTSGFFNFKLDLIQESKVIGSAKSLSLIVDHASFKFKDKNFYIKPKFHLLKKEFYLIDKDSKETVATFTHSLFTTKYIEGIKRIIKFSTGNTYIADVVLAETEPHFWPPTEVRNQHKQEIINIKTRLYLYRLSTEGEVNLYSKLDDEILLTILLYIYLGNCSIHGRRRDRYLIMAILLLLLIGFYIVYFFLY